jgi:predicted alpha/beta-fold hydrolase
MLVQNLKELYKRCKKDIHEHGQVKISDKAVFRCKTIRDIDTVLTAKLYGFDDVDEYWESQSSWKTMPCIRRPILLLNAQDDPLIHPDSTQLARSWANSNENIICVTTSHGGHLGWVTGWRKQWMCPAVAEYLHAVEQSLESNDCSHAVKCADAGY